MVVPSYIFLSYCQDCVCDKDHDFYSYVIKIHVIQSSRDDILLKVKIYLVSIKLLSSQKIIIVALLRNCQEFLPFIKWLVFHHLLIFFFFFLDQVTQRTTNIMLMDKK